MRAASGLPDPSQDRSRPARVIVVNCSTWPRFVPAVRAEALDLYAEGAQVEFWDVTMAESEETLIWGQWPKPFAQHPRRFVDEILDRISNLDEETAERLAVVMVFDAPEIRGTDPAPDRQGGVDRPAGSQAVRIAIAATDRLSRHIADDDPSIRAKVLWIAAFRGAQLDPRSRAAAFDLVAPPAPSGGAGSRLFETAVFLAGTRGSDPTTHHAFTALRTLIDLTRDDEAARALLRAVPNSREGRVLVLRAGRVAHNPSDRTRARLAGFIRSAMDATRSTVGDPAADKVGPIVAKLLDRLSGSNVGRIVAFTAADTAGAQNTGDVSALDAGTEQPSLEQWRDARSLADVADAHARATRELQTLYEKRDSNLARERRSLDDNARENSGLLDELRGAAVDPSFGVSGEVKRHLEQAHARLAAKFETLTRDANGFRDAHTSARVGVKAIPADKLDAPCEALSTALSAWLPASVVIAAAAAAAAVPVLFYGLVLLRAEVTRWAFLPFAATLVVWLLGLLLIVRHWRRNERRRIGAAVGVRKAQEQAIADIKEIGTIGLRHVATARLAGRCLPFLTLMARRTEEIGRVREQMRRVYESLEDADAPSDPDDGFAATAADLLRTRPQEEAFKAILWRATPPETTLQDLEFDIGRSSLRFRSTLTFRGAVRAEIVPTPDIGIDPQVPEAVA